MKYHELTISKHKSPKRVGRGIAAGQGKTAGRGTKGQHARTGSSRKPGFEGGQNPLVQSMPKLRGFTSHKPKTENVYTGQLNELKAKTVDNFTLTEAGLISSPHVTVKLIVKGELKKAMTVKLQAASESAIAATQKAGGTFTQTPRVTRPASEKKQEKRSK
ncbi:MAG TPA: 50S ribosomal protein L15 [Candidatus Saccharimonadales bacterium]|jgi:large subunit ribosomal protein L15